MSIASLHLWLDTFGLDGSLRPHVAAVMETLPEHVREDLVGDPAFSMSDFEPGTGMVHVHIGMPGKNRGGRAVVLKRSLRRRPTAFIQYVIAHELAHAHLRNAGRWPGDDPEHAADALAAQWGFPRP